MKKEKENRGETKRKGEAEKEGGDRKRGRNATMKESEKENEREKETERERKKEESESLVNGFGHSLIVWMAAVKAIREDKFGLSSNAFSSSSSYPSSPLSSSSHPPSSFSSLTLFEMLASAPFFLSLSAFLYTH